MSKRKQKSSEKSDSARARTRERRRERKQQRRERRRIIYAAVVVVIAIAAVATFIIVNQPASAPIPAGTLDRYDQIPQGTTEESYPILGNPEAPVRVEEYSNFACPSCAEHHARTMEALVELVRDGVISYTFIPVTVTGGVSNARGATIAALCAGEQGHFFEYHDALFDWQTTFGNKAFSQNRLVTGVENLALNRGQYNDCVGSSRIDDIIERGEDAFREIGATGTPTILVNGVEVGADATTDELVNRIYEQLAATGLTPIPLGSEAEETPVVQPSPEVTEEQTQEPEEETTPEPEITDMPEATEANDS